MQSAICSGLYSREVKTSVNVDRERTYDLGRQIFGPPEDLCQFLAVGAFGAA
jgi:hypothetical protein